LELLSSAGLVDPDAAVDIYTHMASEDHPAQSALCDAARSTEPGTTTVTTIC
jgi:hypothetical protein